MSPSTTVKRSPNPYGKLGGPKHPGEVERIKRIIDGLGYTPRSEYKVDTSGGMKSYRYVDIAGLDAQGEPVLFYQVGRVTLSNNPIARERYAINDLFEFSGYDVPIIFVPYWK